MPSYRLTKRDAFEIAGRVPGVRALRARRPGLAVDGFILRDPATWVVIYYPRETDIPLGEVRIDDRNRAVDEVWLGTQASWPMARGGEDSFGGMVNAVWVWVPLCVMFIVPFLDPRRPRRLLHLDLLVLLSLTASHWFFNRGEIGTSVPLAYPVLVYLLVRMLVAAFRPRRGQGPLVPYVPLNVLAVLAVALLVGRTLLNIADSSAIDVGYASVVGADRVVEGQELYTDNEIHGDTYGPLNYLAYVPFEAIFPYTGTWDDMWAAQSAAILFDVLTALGLLLIGRQLRPGRQGMALGIVLAYAWCAFPWAAFTAATGTNDGLVAVLLVYAFLALRSSWGRGALLAAAAAVKFVPLILAPLFAARPERAWRPMATFALAGATVVAVTLVPVLPEGGLREFYDATIGFQLGRESPFSIWGQEPSLGWLQTLAKAMVVVLALAAAVIPRTRTPGRIAALVAAVLLAQQLTVDHWFYLYVVWFAPFVLIALFSQHPARLTERTHAENLEQKVASGAGSPL